MRRRDIFRLRLRTVLRRRHGDAEREMQFHLNQQVEEHLAAGMSLDEARAVARREISSAIRRHEECRDTRGLAFLDELPRDAVLTLQVGDARPTSRR